jgi:hypothetical protein
MCLVHEPLNNILGEFCEACLESTLYLQISFFFTKDKGSYVLMPKHENPPKKKKKQKPLKRGPN